ncbi:MAG: LruC domain-containing protein [Bacteroidales bacterium]|nr:LruC domain-containing protein [Bacteroidales bacterium]
MNIFRILILVFLLGTWNSCKKDEDENIPGVSDKTMDQLLIDRLFNWSMVTQNVGISIKALSTAGNPLRFVRFNVYTSSPLSGGILMFCGCTDNDGLYETTIPLPVTTENVTIVTTYNNESIEKNVPVLNMKISALFDGLIPDTTRNDADWDGVPDIFDDYPADTIKAFNSYIPNAAGFNHLIFEDDWPNSGDYDFNDMVISYRFNLITNFQNQVVQVKVILITEATGTLQHDGFGFQLLLDTVLLKRVYGSRLKPGFIHVDDKGFETGQRKAVVIAFDDAGDMFLPPSGGKVTNTVSGSPYVTPDTLFLTIDLKDHISFPVSGLGTPFFNPFIFVNGDRTREIHLPDYPPTDKADSTLFGTFSDNSNPIIYRYYKSRNNLPWALHIPGNFRYPKEGVAINQAYLMFNAWAEMSGWGFKDWYQNTSAGFRNNSMIYSH